MTPTQPGQVRLGYFSAAIILIFVKIITFHAMIKIDPDPCVELNLKLYLQCGLDLGGFELPIPLLLTSQGQ